MGEFNRDRKSMSVLCKPKDESGNILFVKGAPEGLLERCQAVMLEDGSVVPLTTEMRTCILKQFEHMASNALRCLGFAFRNVDGDLATYNGEKNHPGRQMLRQLDSFSSIESQMTFVGLAGLMDPPRPEVNEMIRKCVDAGIRV